MDLITTPKMVRHNVLQGEYAVSGDPDLVFSTILGSCIACCLFDPVARLGGMNHFLLASPPHSMQVLDDGAERFGLYAMELLVNDMIKKGASRTNMRAHLYGGSNMLSGMRAIGTENARFAKEFLRNDRIALLKADTGGEQARRLDFQPVTGRVRCRNVGRDLPPVQATRIPAALGDVELF
ncbi:chemotaxis protein CheD [Blastomonas sp. AAP53]|uniref:chemotaxis protein CheD n=1 Tax=Blastomonas sp. AAP53 TaxID=1248760 RepID=UPI0003684FBA|nr:chemotaxis protein CheD [Blastomonas sp. AAP53]